MIPTVELSNVTFAYPNGVKVLDNFSLQIPQGSIYGFLGPNGAGKSTTIRIVTGLLPSIKGSVFVLGKTYRENRLSILSNIGSIIDSPTFYEHLTANQNLEIVRLAHCLPKSSVGEALELVGLAATGKLKVSQFSLGMKQRLALSMALISKPMLLVLDEPSNGLDPNGIIEIRELLIHINKQFGTTILVSSHLLTEVEKLCTHIAIINRGQQIFEGRFEQLTEKNATNKRVWFTVSNTDGLEYILKRDFEIKMDGKLMVGIEYTSESEIAELNQLLLNNHISVFGIHHEQQSLEEMYIKLFENDGYKKDYSFQNQHNTPLLSNK